ncbi:hypothetical protein BBK14_29365 [Parafrankia soli]|uniref:Uncharacterized protein n=1 Tax=Parafrankia soli TaxID=2599596 RepID=A0A1S1PC21_9ACTN|nr:hypothetical protein BBK14_29365 [Parafrankia soli]
MAALVSAIVAVAGLLLAVFGVPLTGGSSLNQSLAYGAGAPVTSGVSETPAAPASSTSTTPTGPEASPPPVLPSGWRRVSAPGLSVTFAVPDGWTQVVDNDLQSTWHSPNEGHAMSVKRDTSYGSTPEAASAGQLAWYRDTTESSMADLTVVTHPTRQSGKDALWLEIDYHWAGQAEPRKRVELFVAGKAGHVYQLLFDTAATPTKLAAQQQLFATARDQLLIDT